MDLIQRTRVMQWRRRSGFLTFALLVLMVFLCILLILMMNGAAVTAEKIEVNDAAREEARSVGVVLARGMNAVTLGNHLCGEALAMTVVHTAVGGRDVDGADLSVADRRRNDWAVARLRAIANAARQVGGWTLTYQKAIQPLRVAATVGEGKINLKEALVVLYTTQAIVGHIPWIGRALVAALNLVELVIYAEWQALDTLELIARASLPAQRILFDFVAPAARSYAWDATLATPLLAAETASTLAERRRVVAAIDPPLPTLPIIAESSRAGEADHRTAMARSQTVRASWPWVVYDRGPILSFTTPLIFSKAASLFRGWTEFHTTSRAQEFELRHGALFVLADPSPSGKGFESWTTDPRLADERFGLVTFAKRPEHKALGSPYFTTPNPGGVLGYAQALVYNANPQHPETGPPNYQPEVGWDLLNWDTLAPDSGAYEFPFDGAEGMSPSPKVRLNWQAMLVPGSSRIDASVLVTPPEFAEILQRIVPVPPTFRTH